MAVFRVERNTGYTVMSNHHLRNKELSLKAKGLLSQMLSLPEDWDYTLAGLSYINRESIDAIRTAVWELEKAGYITRRQGRDEKGKMTAIEYTIYEQPQPPELDCPVLENPTADNPTTENPTSENPMQLNKDISRTNLQKKEKSNTDLSSTHSIPIHSLNPLPYGEDEAAQPPERKGTERNDAYRVYEEIIKDNIEYNILLQDMKFDHDRLNEIVDIIPPMLAHFAVPLEQVLYMPSVAVAFVATCLCMAENFGTAITPAWLLTMIVVTGLLSLAMPPIPGGALTCYTVMFTQLGIPGEALALAVAINSMIDFIATASNLTCLQVEVTTVAGQLGMLDTECLKNPG